MSVVTWRPIARNAQTFLPRRLHEWRLDAQQWVQRRSGRPHESEFNALRRLLRPGDHVVDVGANRGQSIDSLRSLGIPLRVTAFEPQHVLADRLKWRYPDVDVYQYGLGAEAGEMLLYTPSYRGYRFDGLASCDEEMAVEWFGYSMQSYRSELVSIDSQKIRIVTLDRFTRLRPVDFIKFDVQGMELAALCGAERILRRDRPLLMVETPTVECTRWLTDRGYHPLHVDGDRLVTPVSNDWAANVFFAHESRGATLGDWWTADFAGPPKVRLTARRDRMVDGTVYFDSLAPRQRVNRDPDAGRSVLQRLRLWAKDRLGQDTLP